MKLQAELARMNDEMARVEAQIRNTKRAQALDEQLRADEERRKLNETIRAIQEQVAQLTPTTPFDGSQQLKSPSGRAPIRVTPPMKPPVPIKTVQPQYSAEALQARLQGTVAVEVLVDEKGHVADARVLRSIPLLDKAALEAARQWEFTPTLMNGEPVPILLQLEMNFTLK
ncbi:MAG TPA: TonB family protein [Vicinamibacterales bacterium]|nr:TonB family protein [Vicinamibacterales bacterium]